jgi:hypothetical protein
MFNKHIIQLNTNDPNYTMLGNKQAGIYFQNENIEVVDITASVNFAGHFFMRGRFIVGLVSIHRGFMLMPKQFILVNAHMLYIGYTDYGRRANGLWLLNQANALQSDKGLPVFCCGDFNVDMLNAKPLPEGIILISHRENNYVDMAGYKGAMTVTRQELDWGVNLFTDVEKKQLGTIIRANEILNSYTAGGSHSPLSFVVSLDNTIAANSDPKRFNLRIVGI